MHVAPSSASGLIGCRTQYLAPRIQRIWPSRSSAASGLISLRQTSDQPGWNLGTFTNARGRHRFCNSGSGGASSARSASDPDAAAAAAPDTLPEAEGGITALKEWAVTCAALGSGQQTVVLRKGGIDEPSFAPRGRRFLLFPTSFHSGGDLVKAPASKRYAQVLAAEPKKQAWLEVGVVAEVVGAWTTGDPGVVTALDAFHVWTPHYLEKRLRWRKRQPITVLELRCRRLVPPLTTANSPELWGCFSWVALPGAEDGGVDALWDRGVPSLSDADFAPQQAALRAKLATLESFEVLPVD